MPMPMLAPLEANNGKVAGWEQSWIGRVMGGGPKARGHTPSAVILAPPCPQSLMTPIFSSEAPKRVIKTGRGVHSVPMLHPVGSSHIQASCP